MIARLTIYTITNLHPVYGLFTQPRKRYLG